MAYFAETTFITMFQHSFCSFLLLFIVSALSLHLHAQEVLELMDLQIHPTMHIPYRFFGLIIAELVLGKRLL
jgi:hypothetical protein